ncbi:MAG: LysR substrate-binding domain-containing protein [Pseudomonadota bacterium]
MQNHRTETLIARGLKLSHLRILAALGDTRAIARAAGQVGITQPAASRLLAEIGTIAGQPVHQRTGRGIRLTLAGEALARRARRVLMEMQDAERELAEIRAGGRGHVRIGSVTGPALDRVLPALRTWRLAQPGTTVEVVVATSDELADRLLDGRLDFAVGRLPDGIGTGLLHAETMAAEPVSLVVRAGHRLTRPPAIAPAMLLEYDWVMPGPESLLRQAVVRRLAEMGLPEPRQRLFTASFLLTLALLSQSNSIAPLATAVADTFARGPNAPYAVVPIDLGIEVPPFGMITRADADLPPAARRLADLIRDMGPRTPGFAV